MVKVVNEAAENLSNCYPDLSADFLLERVRISSR